MEKEETRAPELLASTFDNYSCSIAECQKHEDRLQDGSCPQPLSLGREEEQESNFFKFAQWLYSRNSLFL